MKPHQLLAPSVALIWSAFSAPVQAHHSFAMFDRSRTDSIAGTVKAFDMVNPHSWLQLLVPDAQGQEREWSLETGGSGQLTRAGWTSHSLSAGDKVTAVIHPLKDGSNGGQLLSVTLPNGQMLTARGGPSGGL